MHVHSTEAGGYMREMLNGIRTTDLPEVTWRKSSRSSSQGNCVELAHLPEGAVAIRNSRHPAGPALIYTRAEVAAFVLGAKDGDFDDFIP